MVDRLASRTPYLDAVLHALIDPARTEFELRHLDFGRERSVWLAELRQEIAGLSARDVAEVSVPVLTRHFAVIVCQKASGCDLEGVETDVYLAADVEVALASLTPTDAPKGARGRLMLNAYGHTCYDAGLAACADQPWQPTEEFMVALIEYHAALDARYPAGHVMMVDENQRRERRFAKAANELLAQARRLPAPPSPAAKETK